MIDKIRALEEKDIPVLNEILRELDSRLETTEIAISSDMITRGFELTYKTNADLYIEPGTLYNATTRINKTARTTLTFATAADWYDGSTHSYSGGAGWCYVGTDGSENIKLLHTNAPDYADTDGNTTGTKLYYKSGATYYRVIGRVKVNTSDQIPYVWNQVGNTLYYATSQSFACGGSSTFEEADMRGVCSEIDGAAIIKMAGASAAWMFLRAANSSGEGIECTYTTAFDHEGYFTGEISVVAGSTYTKALDYKTNVGTATGFVIGVKLNIR